MGTTAKLYLQSGTGLSAWNPAAPGLELPSVTPTGVAGTTINVEVSGPVDGIDTFDVFIPATPYSADGKLFARLSATE